jgi:predicted nucleotidyltransferase
LNIQVQWRLDFARRVSKLCKYPGVCAIVTGGSVARGYSDIYSDLELILYWDRIPEPDVKRSITADLGAEYRYPKIDQGYESAFLINGFPVDIWHHTVADEESVMDKVLREYSLDLNANNVLDTVRNCIPLYGSEFIQKWKNQAEAYPEELSVRFLQTYLPHFHLRQINFAANRDNPTAYYAMLSAIQSSLFLVILALNESYFPTYKWMYNRIADLPHVPLNLGSRLRQMFYEPPIRAVTQLHSVLTETLAIVEERYPQVDVEFARYGLDQAQPKVYDRKPLHE